MIRLAKEFSRVTIYPHGEFLDIEIAEKLFTAEYLFQSQWRITIVQPGGWLPEPTPDEILNLEGVIAFIHAQMQGT